MSAYHWIIILLCLGTCGLLYACTYDVVSDLHEHAYTNTSDASRGTDIIWKVWQFLPVACIASVIIYAFMMGQKQGGGF